MKHWRLSRLLFDLFAVMFLIIPIILLGVLKLLWDFGDMIRGMYGKK